MRDDLDFYIEERTTENSQFKAALEEEEKELKLAIETQCRVDLCSSCWRNG